MRCYICDNLLSPYEARFDPYDGKCRQCLVLIERDVKNLETEDLYETFGLHMKGEY